MLRSVALVRTYISEEPGASFIRVIRIGELGTTQAATSNRRTLPRSENLKSYIFIPVIYTDFWRNFLSTASSLISLSYCHYNSIQFNSIQFFIIYVPSQQPQGQ
jgi:hypothetical protein